MRLVIVVPALNEEKILKPNIEATVDFCSANLFIDWQIIIVDNDSSDDTASIGQELANRYEKVDYVHTLKRGKGVAIKTGWQSVGNQADVYCFMDADLATDLRALPQLIEEISKGASCVIGSRFSSQSNVKRTLLRSVFSHGYRLVAKNILNIKINDLPCGFKAVNKEVFEKIVPQVKSDDWFFDSELVIMAEKNGFKVVEIPVVWEDIRPQGDESRVKVTSLSFTYFKKIIDLKKRLKI